MPRINTYAVAIDRLEITYSVNYDLMDLLDTSDIYIVEKNVLWLKRKDSKNYKNEFELWCKDVNADNDVYSRNIGLLYFGSHNKFRQNIYISFQNDSLYDGSILRARFYIEAALGLEFYQISKLDICIDFNFNLQRRIMRILRNLDYTLIVNGQVADNAKLKHIGFMAYWNPRWRLLNNPQIIADNEQKNLRMKTYDKKKEIEESSGKYYLLSRRGFTNVMSRIEMSCINHKSLAKTLNSSTINMSDRELYEKLEDEDTLIRIFNHLLCRIIHVRLSDRTVVSILALALKDLQ